MEAFQFLSPITSKVTVDISLHICAWKITHGEGFIGSLLPTFHWPDFGSMAIPDCRGGEEEERNTDFVQELAVLATEHM